MFPSGLAEACCQFTGDGFVFSPGIGVKYAASIGLDLKLSVGFAF